MFLKLYAKFCSLESKYNRIINFREVHFNRTVLNMATATNPIFREIKQIATEAEAMAGVLSNLEDAVVVGPIIRVAMDVSVSVLHA